jgi:hypothetical protein
MPIPWPGLFSALQVVDAAARVWNRVRSGQPAAAEAQVGEKLTSQAQGLTALDARVHALESRAAELQGELVSTSQIVQSLADQHYQVVQAMEALRRRWRVLAWALGALTLILVAAILWLLLR